jgi:type II secretory pathway pseudopilin PulG
MRPKKLPIGMTLVEILVAASMLSIALLATFNAWMGSERLGSIAREEAIAHAAINEVLSRIRSTPFDQITNSQNDPTLPGFSGGDDPSTTFKLLPGQFPARVGGDSLPHGVRVSSVAFQDSVRVGERFYAPDNSIAELRVIFINNENPIEEQLGEISGNKDGVDINRDGLISSTPFPINPPLEYDLFTVGAMPLFPRRLASGSAGTQNVWLNSSQLVVLPIAVQVRWWSKAGMPLQITVVTFLTNRS